VNYYLQVVEEGEKQMGRALAKIGHLYQNAGRHNSALSYYEQALPLLEGEGKSLDVAEIHQSKGSIYEVFGDNAQPQTYYLRARNSYLRAAQIFEDQGSANQNLVINQHLADIATKRRNFNRAVIYQNRVIKTLTLLYQDSLQAQAESFSDLLNKEIESSKDTIYVQRTESTQATKTTVPLTNWRYLVILLLTIGLLISIFGWINQRRNFVEVQDQRAHSESIRKQLVQQNEELQKLNKALTIAEKEQRRSNLTKDKLFSIISHDLRSPINTISGFLNILSSKLSSIGDIELRDLTQELIQNTDRMSYFLDDLLKWSMTQLGRIEPSVEKLDLKNMVEKNYLLEESRLKAKNIHFKASIPEDISLYADKNMVRLILRNLISNAIKFTRKEGYIAVTLKHGTPGTSLLIVSDDGIGMSDEKLQEIFEFTGSEINGGGNNQGAGLGLLLCKEFAEINGGDIGVTSKLGEGTVFTVSLPDHPTV
jgi:signal transduction histidine kinase